MRSDDLAPLMRQPKPDVGFRQGLMIAWDPLTGANQVQIGGTVVDDVPTLSTSTMALAAGDVVGLIRFQSTFFITGRIAPAGGGALSMRSAQVPTLEGTTSETYTDLATPGPSLTATIGLSRQCLVIAHAVIQLSGPMQGTASFAVSGASSIAATWPVPCALGTSETAILHSSSSSVTLLTEADGLNPGENTFTMKYARTGPTASEVCDFSGRIITVIPY